MNTPRIAIIGGGVGGLACARGLQVHGHSVTVFERETSSAARWQGGMLDLHAPTGQAALRAIGLFEQFGAMARPEAEEMRWLDPITGALVGQELPSEGKSYAPEIDRGHLRDILLNSLTPGTLSWGSPVDAVTALDDGTASVRFADGTTEVFDLVIGADGAWSRTRPAVSDATPVYSGDTMVETFLEDVDHRHPALADLIGAGSMGAELNRTGLMTQRNSGGHVRVYAMLEGVAVDWYTAAGIDLDDTEAVREHLLAGYDGWNDTLLGLIRDSDGGFVNRPIHELPDGHTWQHVPGVTLIGDAAHLRGPNGTGANLALIDGTDLAGAIAGHDDLDEAVLAFESIMLPRAAAVGEAEAEVAAMMDDESTRNINAARQVFNEHILNA